MFYLIYIAVVNVENRRFSVERVGDFLNRETRKNPIILRPYEAYDAFENF